jgi:hypothetical protein
MAELLWKQLESLNNEVAVTKAELANIDDGVLPKPEGTTLQAERARLLKELDNLRERQEKMEDVSEVSAVLGCARGQCALHQPALAGPERGKEFRSPMRHLLGYLPSGLFPYDLTTRSCGGRPGQCGRPRSW